MDAASTVEFLKGIAERIDFEALFAALPEEEFSAMIDDRLEKIEEEKRIVATAQERVARLEREVESFRAALRIKGELAHRQAQAEAQVPSPEPSLSIKPRELMQRKRAAVTRMLRAETDRSLSPEQTEALIRQRGLLSDEELQAGTPIRIVMAKLAAEGVLERSAPGKYRLAAEAAPENGAMPRVQTGDPSSPQKPPPEEFAAPPVGHPYNTEGVAGSEPDTELDPLMR